MPGPELATVQAKTILTPAVGYVSGGYTHTLNPYQGCGFGADLTDASDTASGDGNEAGRGDRGCPYCYVRRMPVALFGPGPWGSWVSAKTNAPDLVRAEGRRGRLALARIFLAHAIAAGWGGIPVVWSGDELGQQPAHRPPGDAPASARRAGSSPARRGAR